MAAFATQGIPLGLYASRRGGDVPAATRAPAQGAPAAQGPDEPAGRGGWMYVTQAAVNDQLRRATNEQLVEQARRLRNSVGNMVARQDAKNIQERIDNQFTKNVKIVLDLFGTMDSTIRAAREATEHPCCRAHVESILQDCRGQCAAVHDTMTDKIEGMRVRHATASKPLAAMTRDELVRTVRHLVRLDSGEAAGAAGAGDAGATILSLWRQLEEGARSHCAHLRAFMDRIDRGIQAKLDDTSLNDCCRGTLRELQTSVRELPERLHTVEDADLRHRALQLEVRRQGGEELSIEDQNLVRLAGDVAGKTFSCDPCFSEGLGLADVFVMDVCHHVACLECTRGQVDFAMGNDKVDAIECLEGDHAHIQYADVQKVLAGDAEKLARYEDLLLNKVLKDHPETVVCPRAQCSIQFFAPQGELRVQCPSEACGLEFCTSCRVEWHHDSTCEQFQQFLRENAQADDLNEAWIRRHAKTCPGCRFPVQKSQGCNHMTCTRCDTHFCYRCEEVLPGNDPYRHFNTPDTPCYQHLFD